MKLEFLPLVLFGRVDVLIGNPYGIKPQYQAKYQEKGAKTVVIELTEHCHHEIVNLLRQGCV